MKGGSRSLWAEVNAEPTVRVSQLCGEIQSLVRQGFSSLWVAGEVQRVQRSQRGHLYFELVDKGQGDRVTAKIDAVIWRSDLAKVERELRRSDQKLAPGVELRCRGGVDFWPPGGRLQLVVREVDPAFSLGQLELRRRQTLAALQKAELLDRNSALPLPPVPLRVGMVSSYESAAYHDFLSSLQSVAYGFEVTFVHAAMQGAEAEREVVSALRALAGLPLDVVVVVRGGGSRTDLAAFDSRAISEAIARFPLPVVTGIGHEIDQSIADRVAHTAVKTPTGAAELLIDRVAGADLALEQIQQRLLMAARDPLSRGKERLLQAERGMRRAQLRLASVSARLEEQGRRLARLGGESLRRGGNDVQRIAQRLGVASPRFLERRRELPETLMHRVVISARARLARAHAEVDGRARLCRDLDPQRTLERGFSITRGADGRLLRGDGDLAVGDLLVTRFAAGSWSSRVEAEQEDLNTEPPEPTVETP